MCPLPDWRIRELAQKGMIKPFFPERLSSYGYDITLDNVFKIPRDIYKEPTIIDPKAINPKYFEDYEGDYCLIPPHGFVLGQSVEYFKIPRNILAVTFGRSLDYSEPVLVYHPGGLELVKIGQLVEERLTGMVFSFNSQLKLVLSPILDWISHPAPEYMLEISTSTGRKVRVSPDHSLFSVDAGANPVPVRADGLVPGEWILVPSRLPKHDQIPELAQFISPKSMEEASRCTNLSNSALRSESEDSIEDNIPNFSEIKSKLRKLRSQFELESSKAYRSMESEIEIPGYGMMLDSITSIRRLKPETDRVYDISSFHQNFMGGNHGMVACHNSSYARAGILINVTPAEPCLPEHTNVIVEHENKIKLIPISELGKILRECYVFGLNYNYQIVKTKPAKLIYSGIKPVFSIELSRNAEFQATGNHVVFSLGWDAKLDPVFVDELSPGDYIAVANFPQIKSKDSIIPLDGNYIRKLIASKEISWKQDFEKFNRGISRRKLESMNLRDPQLDRLLRSQISWTKIKSIKSGEEHRVYDLVVPELENFLIEDGIIVHNCWVGRLTLEISNLNPYYAKVYAHEGIGQMVFFECKELCMRSYPERSKKYHMQLGITLPRL